MLSPFARAVFLLLVAACLAWACRWAWRRSPAWAIIVAVGAAIRLSSGLVLFAISYYHWPLFESLQTGDGFWAVAPDARAYYEMAAATARQKSLSMPAGSPSPVYVAALSLWFRAAGVSIATAVVFNVACYIVACAAIISVLGDRGRRLGTLVLFSFAFSPALLLTSTQVLKDAFFLMLIVAGCVSALQILRYSRHSLSEHGRQLTPALGAAVLAMAAIGGVRAYYAVLVWIALAGALVAALWTVHRTRRAAFAAFAASVLVLLWCAFAVGADAYYGYYRNLIARATGVNLSISALASGGDDREATVPPDLSQVGGALSSVREGFIASGGATNFAMRTGRRGGQGILQVAGDLALGAGVTFVPISLLRAVSLISFEGGRGLLAITDLDTLFLDLTLLAMCVAMWQARAGTAHNVAAMVFLGALVLISTGLIAYVVTNFGTLFRLRLLMAAPAWLAPAALLMNPVDVATERPVRRARCTMSWTRKEANRKL